MEKLSTIYLIVDIALLITKKTIRIVKNIISSLEKNCGP